MHLLTPSRIITFWTDLWGAGFSSWYPANEGFGFAGAVNGVGDGSVKNFNHGFWRLTFSDSSGFVIGYAYGRPLGTKVF